MSKTDFLPRKDGDLDAFEQNFISKLPAIAEVMQLDPAEVTRILTNINDHRTVYFFNLPPPCYNGNSQSEVLLNLLEYYDI